MYQKFICESNVWIYSNILSTERIWKFFEVKVWCFSRMKNIFLIFNIIADVLPCMQTVKYFLFDSRGLGLPWQQSRHHTRLSSTKPRLYPPHHSVQSVQDCELPLRWRCWWWWELSSNCREVMVEVGESVIGWDEVSQDTVEVRVCATQDTLEHLLTITQLHLHNILQTKQSSLGEVLN